MLNTVATFAANPATAPHVVIVLAILAGVVGATLLNRWL